jgi:hypothetical protein
MKIACSIPATTQTAALQPPSQLRQRLQPWFKAFFCRCAASSKRTAERAHDLLNSSLVHLSTVTTPNGPWVYTIVPWED